MTVLKTEEDKIVFIEKQNKDLSPVEKVFVHNSNYHIHYAGKVGFIVPVDLEHANCNELGQAYSALKDSSVKQPLDRKQDRLKEELSNHKGLAITLAVGSVGLGMLSKYNLNNTQQIKTSTQYTPNENNVAIVYKTAGYTLTGLILLGVITCAVEAARQWSRIKPKRLELDQTFEENKARKDIQSEFILNKLERADHPKPKTPGLDL